MCFIKRVLMLFLAVAILNGCAGHNELSEEEVFIQQKATNALTNILFEYELDENATFEVEKSGHVNLRIEGLVSVAAYTNAIDAMRAHSDIDGVYAQQGGKEICPLTIIVR